MHTRYLMMSSAIFMALLGLLTSYLPGKVLTTHGTVPDNATLLLVQMMGGLYLGFAILNWTARGILMGGIYARPVALGNFLHFAIDFLTCPHPTARGVDPQDDGSNAIIFGKLYQL